MRARSLPARASSASMFVRISRVWAPTAAPALFSATCPAVKTRLPQTTAWLMRGPGSIRSMAMESHPLSAAIGDARQHAEHLEQEVGPDQGGVARRVVGRRNLDQIAADQVQPAA